MADHQGRCHGVEQESADAVGGAQAIALARNGAGEGVVAVFVAVEGRGGHGQGDAAVGQVLRRQVVRDAADVAFGVFERQGQHIVDAGTRWQGDHGGQTIDQFLCADAIGRFGHDHSGCAGQPVDGVDEGLDFGQGVDGAGIGAGHSGIDGLKHTAQIVAAHTAQANGLQVLCSHGCGGDLPQADLHHAVSDAGQIQDLGGAVHAGAVSVVQDVVEQATVCVEVDDLAQTQGRDVGVAEGCARAFCAIGQCADFF